MRVKIIIEGDSSTFELYPDNSREKEVLKSLGPQLEVKKMNGGENLYVILYEDRSNFEQLTRTYMENKKPGAPDKLGPSSIRPLTDSIAQEAINQIKFRDMRKEPNHGETPDDDRSSGRPDRS